MPRLPVYVPSDEIRIGLLIASLANADPLTVLSKEAEILNFLQASNVGTRLPEHNGIKFIKMWGALLGSGNTYELSSFLVGLKKLSQYSEKIHINIPELLRYSLLPHLESHPSLLIHALHFPSSFAGRLLVMLEKNDPFILSKLVLIAQLTINLDFFNDEMDQAHFLEFFQHCGLDTQRLDELAQSIELKLLIPYREHMTSTLCFSLELLAAKLRHLQTIGYGLQPPLLQRRVANLRNNHLINLYLMCETRLSAVSFVSGLRLDDISSLSESLLSASDAIPTLTLMTQQLELFQILNLVAECNHEKIFEGDRSLMLNLSLKIIDLLRMSPGFYKSHPFAPEIKEMIHNPAMDTAIQFCHAMTMFESVLAHQTPHPNR